MAQIAHLKIEGKPLYARIEKDRIYRIDSPFQISGGTLLPAIAGEQIEYLPPILPNKLFAVGRNYTEHIREIGGERPSEPLFWLKAPSSILPHNGFIQIPYPEHRTDFEIELAIVIGKTGKNIPLSSVQNYILGYTCALDITDRTIQKVEGQWSRCKSFDTFTPLGPVIETDLDPSKLKIQLFQNDILKQDGNTEMMIFNCHQIISHVSQGITLSAGDVILTGTPCGIGPITSGDTLKACIEGIPPLTVHVK